MRKKKKKMVVHCFAPPGDGPNGWKVGPSRESQTWMSLIELDRPLNVYVAIGLKPSARIERNSTVAAAAKPQEEGYTRCNRMEERKKNERLQWGRFIRWNFTTDEKSARAGRLSTTDRFGHDGSQASTEPSSCSQKQRRRRPLNKRKVALAAQTH